MTKHHQPLFTLTLAATAALLVGCGAGKKDADAFLKEAARKGMAEVDLSRLAVESASHPEVREFAQRMIEDHERTNQEVLALAQRKRVRVPQADRDGAWDDRLAERTGRDFDREYMRRTVEEHEKTIELFRTQSKDGKDADVRAFAAQTLPTLREHLQMATQLRDRVERNEGMDGMPGDTTMPADTMMHGTPMPGPQPRPGM